MLSLRVQEEENKGKEEEIILFYEEDIKSGVEDCRWSLVGRLLADKSFSLGIMESALGAIYGHPRVLG